MKTNIQYIKNGIEIKKNYDLPDTESEFYKSLAEIIIPLMPGHICVECKNGKAEYNGSLRSNSISVFDQNNLIKFEAPGNYPTKFLTCINPKLNQYKFYKLEQTGDTITASYGRIGTTKDDLFHERSYTYTSAMYWIKYIEKISKGYIDQTEFYIDQQKDGINIKQKSMDNIKKSGSKASCRLFEKLQKYSKQVVERTFTKQAQGIMSPGMAKRARELLTELYSQTNLEGFNSKLIELLVLAPRNILNVKDQLAVAPSDFKKILSREESIVSSMEAAVMGRKFHGSNDANRCFEDIGIHVEQATEEEKAFVISHLNSNKTSGDLKSKVRHVYKVSCPEHISRYEAYCKKKHIANTKMLWHGSRNENWLSIIKNGLLLNPNAIITGKMFGNGVYFAPKATKSWNYTSYHGSYYANGCSDRAFMGLYETAYGNPLNVTSAGNYSEKTLSGKDCVHAHAGRSLINDEIIYYNEAAMVLRYIVEFA